MICDGTKILNEITILLQSNLLTSDAVVAFEYAMEIVKRHDMDVCGADYTITLLDGNELSPHVFEEVERCEDATVMVMQCEHCGKQEIWWERNHG